MAARMPIPLIAKNTEVASRGVKGLLYEDSVDSIYSIWQWVVEFVVPFKPNNEETWGQLGDWIGGTGGTIATFASFLALLYTLRLSRNAAIQQGAYAIFATMSKTHDDLTASFQMYDSSGRDVFKLLLKDFSVYLKATTKNYPELNTRDAINVAYSLFFYGSTVTGRDFLKDKYNTNKINLILNDVSATRNRLTALYPNTKDHRLSGNQGRLSNYYRNLYATYTFIDESQLPKSDKRRLLKTIRTKMNNHEQALLALNICSDLGSKWVDDNLLTKYHPIKNIPEAFFSLPNNDKIQDLLPEVNYEFLERKDFKSKIFSFRFFRFTTIIKISRPCTKLNIAPNQGDTLSKINPKIAA